MKVLASDDEMKIHLRRGTQAPQQGHDSCVCGNKTRRISPRSLANGMFSLRAAGAPELTLRSVAFTELPGGRRFLLTKSRWTAPDATIVKPMELVVNAVCDGAGMLLSHAFGCETWNVTQPMVKPKHSTVADF